MIQPNMHKEYMTLPENYARNVELLRKNLKLGMTKSQALSVIRGWQRQFEKAHLLGDAEKEFLNEALRIVDLPMNITIA